MLRAGYWFHVGFCLCLICESVVSKGRADDVGMSRSGQMRYQYIVREGGEAVRRGTQMKEVDGGCQPDDASSGQTATRAPEHEHGVATWASTVAESMQLISLLNFWRH